VTPAEQIKSWINETQELALLTGRTAAALVRRPWHGKETVEQMDLLGVGSLGIVILTGLFAGMALAMQFSIELASFGAKSYLGRAVTVSILRELGPVLTGLMVAGRVCSGITAELGAMKITQQIDAMRVLGSDPIKKLVGPRIVAVVVMLPILTVISDAMGVLGGYSIAIFVSRISTPIYWAEVGRAFTFENVIGALTKPFVFGLIIALIGCHQGLRTAGGTRGIGRATTRAVVLASILILMANFLLTKLLVGLLGWET
jgi:phospholipid/cholesterol/gamma-HCH transport system permease protein